MLTGKELGHRLRELRLEAGYTQGAVAEALGCSRSAYTYLEDGKTELRVEVLQKLAAIYQISADSFLTVDSSLSANQKRMRGKPKDPAEKIGDLKQEEMSLIALLRVKEAQDPQCGLTEELTGILQARGAVS